MRIILLLIFFVPSLSYPSPFPEERIENWVIWDTSSEGNFSSAVIGFDTAGETKMMYECNYSLRPNIKFSSIKLLFPDALPKNGAWATLTYSSDTDSSISMSDSLNRNEIYIYNLYLWAIIKKSSWISFNINIDNGKDIIFRQNKILFNLNKFAEVLNKANEICKFK